MPSLHLSPMRFLTVALAAFGVILAVGCGKAGKETSPPKAEAQKAETAPAEPARSGETAAPTSAQAPAGWVEYGSEPHGFTILTPKSFEVSRDKTQTEAGEMPLTTYLAELGKIAYGVTCNDFPEALLKGKDANAMIKGGSKGFIDQFGGTVTGERLLSLDGNPGLEIALTGATQGVKIFAKGRIYLVGNRMYQVFVIAEQGAEDIQAIDRFLGSFKLKI